MSDTVLLGVICLGLAFYCLYLRHRLALITSTGMFTAALLVEAIQKHAGLSEADAAIEAHRMAVSKLKK
jgi:hypothetical protein